MFNLSPQTVVYVLCPSYFKTGGTELAHQLVKEINRIGGKARITYYGKDERIINPVFLEYVSEFENIEEVNDEKENVLIIPEVIPEIARKFKKIQKCVWWMSVDNFTTGHVFWDHVNQNGWLKAIEHVVRGKFVFGLDKIDPTIHHLYQSEYAKQFLLSNGIPDCEQLSDYINDAYINDEESIKRGIYQRENIVLYNPKKGYEFTKQLIEHTDIQWVPLQNMTNEEVKAMLSKAKVYIDFGNHPGKDRFPREAAISGCCVVTGLDGSAGNRIDIPISDKFKMSASPENIHRITETIGDCVRNYGERIIEFEKYREMIRNEHRVFVQDVRRLFSL